ncbi:MAG TPA: LytTR family DNA-binding domain-containing protein [Bacteroidia bacterium]|nr:LytTR family DNA-binding domain-containing protein [Bacteroidia bacterium]
MLRAILVDDEPRGLNALKTLIDRYCPELRVVSTCLSSIDSVEQINTYHPEIVFLDINMPEMNGFDVLNQLEWKGFHLIFTTAHQEYALKALKANALDYLLKPIDRFELAEAVARIKQKARIESQVNNFQKYEKFLNGLHLEAHKKVHVHSRISIDTLDPDQIVYLESKSNYTQIHLENEASVLSSKTLKDYENILCDQRAHFMRVHHSFIINLRKVSRYIKSNEIVIMRNEQKVPIAKSRKEEFMKWLEI